jgi:hypothetical protein
MGCDIHMFTEVKNNKGEWECSDFFTINKYFDEEGEPEFNHEDAYTGRDYLLFGALAGVRYSEVEHPEPKGFPSDASKECAANYKDWDMDAHTPSWFTLEELKVMATKQLLKNENPLNDLLHQLKNFRNYRFNSFDLKVMQDSDFRIVFWFDN